MPISVVIRLAQRPASGKGPRDEPSSPPSLTFDGARTVIGRGAGCEVRLPDPSVSQRHATIRVEGSGYALVDEGSTNGTFVGDVRLTPHVPRTLRHGDVLRVGRVWLEDAMRAIGDDISPRIDIVEGPDRGRILVLEEEGRAYVAGRGEECDFLLDDMDGSREHIQLIHRTGGVFARDLGSKNGAWLGESPVPRERDVVWRSPTMLRI
jgi:pSer/pThr/pTyr-binding forkhead associated (FHA) protein